MSRTFDGEDIVEVLRGIRRIAEAVKDQTRDYFGDPFVGRLTDEECRRIADSMQDTRVVGDFVPFQNGMMLIWTNLGGRLRFELSAQCEWYAATITAVNEYLQKHGFMPVPAMIFE